MRTTTAIVVLLAALFASVSYAQIFPRIEKEDVKKRIATGSAEPEAKDEPEPEDTPEDTDVDGDKALKRYNELLDSYLKDERAQKKASTKHTDELHVSIRDYFEGVFLLRMGMYKEAERKLKDVGVDVKREKEIKSPELQKQADEIKKGIAYYQRMIAVVMQHWDDFKTEEDAEAAWAKASKDGIEVRSELEKLIKNGKAAEDSKVVNYMTAWLLATKRQWVQTWKYEQNIKKHPESQFSWQFFIAATGSRQNNMKEDYTPHYLKQRAALQVMREFFPHTNYVRGGNCDVTMAVNHLSVGQLDEVDDDLLPRDYHSIAGRAELLKARKIQQDFNDGFKALQNK